jgi:hypothetical protein
LAVEELKVAVAVAAPPLARLTGFGAKAALSPEGTVGPRERLTFPARPPVLARKTVEVPVWPDWKEIVKGLTVSEKSGTLETMTLTVAIATRVSFWVAAVHVATLHVVYWPLTVTEYLPGEDALSESVVVTLTLDTVTLPAMLAVRPGVAVVDRATVFGMPRPGQPFLGVRVIVEVPEKELSTGPIIEGFALMKRKGGGVEFLKLPL